MYDTPKYLEEMRTKNKLVYGVGVNDYDSDVYNNKIPLNSYKSWGHMIERCYSPRFQIRNPTYIGCSVCDEWLLFSNFKKWFDENYVDGFALDKDILVEGNKVYSPDTCRFVPQYLNNLLNNRVRVRENLPRGVIEHLPSIKTGRITSTFEGACFDGNGLHLRKTFKTIEEASTWYSETKKRIVKEQAIRAFLDNAIKTDVYLALVRRRF